MTAISLATEAGISTQVVETHVQFIQLGLEVCEAYLATKEPWDKAGGYGIQGLAGAFVESLDGSYSGVVGLPLSLTWQLLQRVGVATALDAPGS